MTRRSLFALPFAALVPAPKPKPDPDCHFRPYPEAIEDLNKHYEQHMMLLSELYSDMHTRLKIGSIASPI